jgi:hypothetical protein
LQQKNQSALNDFYNAILACNDACDADFIQYSKTPFKISAIGVVRKFDARKSLRLKSF